MKIIFGVLVVSLSCSVVILNIFKNFMQNKTGGFVRGEIIVVFKPEITEKEAHATLEKYHLKETERFFRYDYISFYSTDNNPDEYAAQLIKTPPVQNTEVVTGSSAVKPWIIVYFSRLVNRDEINEILKSFDNLYVDSNFYSIDTQKIKVPLGKEKYYSEKLQMEPTVKTSTVNMIGGLD